MVGVRVRVKVGVRNTRTRKSILSDSQIQKLDELGFIWNTYIDKWDEGFSALKVYKEREGDCLVPQLYIESDFKLGSWVANQRSRKHSLSTSRILKLDGLGFAWNSLTEKWEEGFSALLSFKTKRILHRGFKPCFIKNFNF